MTTRLCFGFIAALLSLAALGPARAMEFTTATVDLPRCSPACPAIIVASGEIALDSDVAFVRFVASRMGARPSGQRGISRVVVMSSPGGNVLGSMRLGLVLRTLGFAVMVGQIRDGALVTARCYSACAYTLAGGLSRIVPPGSQVGVHRAWTRRRLQRDIAGSGSIDAHVSSDGVSPVIERYLTRMGVSRDLVALADTIPSSDIRVLSAQELTRLRVVTPATSRAPRKRRG
jgi:hypothetical protein